jgi:hypothetical protein
LHFWLTDHAAVLARAKAAGVELESKLIAAQDAGQLKTFNQKYAGADVRRRSPGGAYALRRGTSPFTRCAGRRSVREAVGDVVKAVFDG